MALKTTLTPAEHADSVQGAEDFSESIMLHEKTAPSASDILFAMVARGPLAFREVVVRARDCGSASATVIDVKKNGSSILAAVASIDNADADGTVKIALPLSDAVASIVAGDVITVETGTVATAVADLSVEARIAKRYA
jgi:hypothetical protein